MALIDEVMAYARIHDDDETLATSLVAAAKAYLTNAGIGEAESDPLYVLAVQMLATHWYENRGVVQVGVTTKQFEMGISGLINQLQHCGGGDAE